jgi:hypothetical protein
MKCYPRVLLRESLHAGLVKLASIAQRSIALSEAFSRPAEVQYALTDPPSENRGIRSDRLPILEAGSVNNALQFAKGFGC